MSASPSTARRVVVAGAVGLVAALGGLASVTVHAGGEGRPTASAARAVGSLAGASSTEWSCAGPLPVGSKTTESLIELTNTGDTRVRSTISFALTSGRSSRESLSVDPGVPVVARPPSTWHGMAAARVVANGIGLSVVELVHTSDGPIEAPCEPATATTEFLVAGDTRRKDNVALSLYDPGSTPAVASVSFATASGRQTPPAFQGVPIGAGELVVMTVADRVPFAPELAMTVRTSGGSLAVGALDTTAVNGSGVAALEQGVRAPSSRWLFATAPAGPAASQVVDLLNPSARTAKVAVNYVGAHPSPKVEVVVPAGGLARVALNTESATRALGAAEVTSTNGVPIVAARELRVDSVIPAALLPERDPATRRRRASLLVPRIAVGYSITGGIARTAKRWVIGGGESDKAIAELVTVTNPTAKTATVVVRLAGVSVPLLSTVTITPFDSRVIDLGEVPAATGRFAVVVSSDVPVVASGDLYDKGSVGFTSSAAIPLD